MDDLYPPLEILCKRRRSVRAFEPRPVPAAFFEQIQTIARTSPYASGRKNWSLKVVRDPALISRMGALVENRAAELTAELREDFRPHFLEYARHFTGFAQAPALLIPIFKAFATLSFMKEKPDDALQQWERDNYVKSIACVSMLTLLAAESLGLGACLMTGPLLAADSLSTILELRPNQQIGAIIPVGYPANGNGSYS